MGSMPKTSIILNTLSDPRVAEKINQGTVVVIPTDTVYGLACRADNPEAIKQVFALKQREAKRGTVIAASIDQLVDLGVKRRYLKAVEQYWPNPISIEIPLGDELQHLHQGLGHNAFRVTNNAELNALLEKTGPLLTSSVNLTGQPPANTIAEARAYFGDKVEVYVDGGDLSDRLPSTLIRIVDDAIDVVRQGSIEIDENGRIV
jgi:L-threonylcarbamoyladenylate synthase